MTILAGYGPEDRGRGGLELARMLAESSGRSLLVCCVIPERWQSVSAGRQVDRDYEDYLQSLAHHALEHAREVVGDIGVEVTYQVVTARSAPVGLSQVSVDHDVVLKVFGSSADGAWGHIALGSVTDRMLHSAKVPVALAPRGFRCLRGQRVQRLTVGVDGSAAASDVLQRAANVATDVGARLRLVSFAVRPRTMFPPEVGLHVEDRIVEEWRHSAATMMREELARLDVDHDPEPIIADGGSWTEAIEQPGWGPGDVLVIGSSSSEGKLARVFLGSTASRIIRHSPVPVAVVPSGR